MQIQEDYDYIISVKVVYSSFKLNLQQDQGFI